MIPPPNLALTGYQPHDALYLQPALASLGCVVRCFNGQLDAEALHDCDGVISFVCDQLDASALASLKARGVRFIVQRAVGVDNIDLGAARSLGIRVAHVPAYSPESVAEHALTLLLAIARNLPHALREVQRGNFSLDGLLGFSLHGKTVGIVGMGHIGRSFARILMGFGCRVLAHSRSPFQMAGVTAVSLDVLWREADVVSLHCPLNATTRHLVDAASLRAAKPGLVLVNTARGGVVDTHAVLMALDSGQLAAYGADVYENEACVFFRDHSVCGYDDPLLKRLLAHPRALVTPHQAFFTREALQEIAASVAASVSAYARGEDTAAFLV
jgi:D-lactate dehydrogenase